MSFIENIKDTASRLKSEKMKGANYILIEALLSLKQNLTNFKGTDLIDSVKASCNLLFQIQPTMAPLANHIALVFHYLKQYSKKSNKYEETRQNLIMKIEELIENYQSSLETIIKHASNVIPNKSNILTYSFSSTVYETIKFQKNLGKELKIYITESRPNNEGLIGARELAKLYPTTLLIDAGIGYVMKEFSIDLILIGADSFTKTELLHKIGTLPLAITAHEYDIPIYALTHSMKYYFGEEFNIPIVIEPKPIQEISDQELDNVEIRNYYFDRTPIKYLTGIITEDGIYDLKKNHLGLYDKFPRDILEKLYKNIK